MASLVKMGLKSEGGSDAEVKEKLNGLNNALKDMPSTEELKKAMEGMNDVIKDVDPEKLNNLKDAIEDLQGEKK